MNPLRAARMLAVAVIGGTLILAGVVMLVTPGPGWGAIFAGLAVLSAEFMWARRLLRHAREQAGGAAAHASKWWQRFMPGKRRNAPREEDGNKTPDQQPEEASASGQDQHL